MTRSTLQAIFQATGLLALFAVIGVGIVALVQSGTEAQIAENERQATLRNISELIAPERFDNDIFSDLTEATHPNLLGSEDPLTAYRARKEGAPVAIVLTAIAPNGYNGRIKLLIGINYDGTLSGVRVLTHNETPGLGDSIDVAKSDWIKEFDHKSLTTPQLPRWYVKKDGGDFDQFTGATITPRAIVKAVKGALIYYRDHRSELFVQPDTSK